VILIIHFTYNFDVVKDWSNFSNKKILSGHFCVFFRSLSSFSLAR